MSGLMEMLGKREIAWIEKVMNKLPFIKWDRYHYYKDTRPIITVFGWIDREDSYKDFVVLEFDTNKQLLYFIATSSAKYSKKISEILGSKHFPCERVESTFEVDNVCKKKK